VDIKICISTTKTHSEKTLPIIVQSLLNCAVDKDSIYIFEGGHLERTEEFYQGVRHIKTNHNSFDYTSLIDIVEHEIKADYWFLLHDTCKVGPLFKQLFDNAVVKMIIPTDADKIALKNNPSMNIGFYKYDYLMKHKEEILLFKGTNPETIDQLKQEHINKEDFLFFLEDSLTHILIGAENPVRGLGKSDVYGTGTTRRTEYYVQLDLYKFKANWGQSTEVKINL
jgi:hypothetical protein